MESDDASPAPDGLSDVPSFKAGLRRLKAWSGMSYRELERRATAGGEHLPATTIADMLSPSRSRMPREEQIRSLVRACGRGEDQVAAWVRTRRRIVMNEAAPPDVRPDAQAEDEAKPAQNEPPAPRSPAAPAEISAAPSRRPFAHRRTLFTASLTAVGTLLAVAAGAPFASRTHDGQDRARELRATPRPLSQGLPAAGPYRIRVAHSGLCLSERRGATSGLVLQMPCAQAFPPMSLENESPTRYRIAIDHPEFGPGCMGISKARKTPGPYVFDDHCGDENAGAESFVFTPSVAPVPGYVIRVVHSGLCLGFPETSVLGGAPLHQMACAESSGQVFTLVPR